MDKFKVQLLDVTKKHYVYFRIGDEPTIMTKQELIDWINTSPNLYREDYFCLTYEDTSKTKEYYKTDELIRITELEFKKALFKHITLGL